MKILMTLEGEFPHDVRVENEMQALSEAGHEVHLACFTKKDRPKYEIIDKIFVHRKKISSLVHKSSVGCLKFPMYFSFWKKFINHLMKNDNFDVIHIHDLPLIKIGVELKKKFDIKLVVDLHENWPALLKNAAHTQTLVGKLLSSNSQWINYEKKMLPYADLIITIIEEAKQRVTDIGIDPKKICIVSNTVNIDNIPITKNNEESEFLTIFYGGAINAHRGLQIVFEAIKLVINNNTNIRLWIVGDGSYKNELELLTNKLNIESYVKFFGHKPFDEMIKILAKSDLAVIPHLRNDNNDASSPNKLYQYMYLNKPIIASDCTSLKRIIEDTSTGFIYKHDSSKDLAQLIEKLNRERSLLNTVNKNGRKVVIEKYNWNIDKEKLMNAYHNLYNNIYS